MGAEVNNVSVNSSQVALAHIGYGVAYRKLIARYRSGCVADGLGLQVGAGGRRNLYRHY